MEEISRLSLSDLVERDRGQEVEDIFSHVCNQARTLLYQRKLTYIHTKNLSDDERTALSNQKAGAYLTSTGVCLDVTSVVFYMFAAGASMGGSEVLRGVFDIAAKSFEKGSTYHQEAKQAKITKFDHGYQSLGNNTQEYAQQIHDLDAECKKMADMIDRVRDKAQRSFEAIAAPAA